MTLRLVISDVDGTLVNQAKELTEPTIAAVGRLRAAGLPFTLISARPPSGVLPLVTFTIVVSLCSLSPGLIRSGL